MKSKEFIRRMKIGILFLLLLVHAGMSAQQYVDIVRFTVSGTPLNTFDSSLTSTRVQETVADVTAPLKLNDSLAIVTGFLYENLRARLTSFSEDLTSAHAITIKAGVNIQHNSKWKGTYMFMPKVSSDFVRLGKKDFQFGGSVIMKCKKSDYFSWQFGGYYNSELFGPFFVPFLGFYYKSPNTKFESNVLLPASVDMNYSFTPSFRLGGSFVSFVKTFHINQQYGSSSTSYWNKSTNEIFGYVQIEPAKGLLVQMRAGYSIARRFTLYDASDKVDLGIMAFKFGDDRTKLNRWFEDGGIFQVRLIYRFYMK